MKHAVTPWRDLDELREVRAHFYAPYPDSQTRRQQRQRACDSVTAWTLRLKCPLAIVATAQLTDALLHDQTGTASIMAITGAYAAALAQFVTSMADTQQLTREKQSMFNVARAIGLPVAFIELRHQIVHGGPPSLVELRGFAERALAWLFENYWKHLIPDDVPEGGTFLSVEDAARSAIQTALQRYLQRVTPSTSQAQEEEVARQIRQASLQASAALAQACIDCMPRLQVLAERLLDQPSFLLPATQQVKSESTIDLVAPCFSTWDPLLHDLGRSLPASLMVLVDEMVHRLPQAEARQENERECQALHDWLLHILTSGPWKQTRSRSGLTPAPALRACLAAPTPMTVQLLCDILRLQPDISPPLREEIGMALSPGTLGEKKVIDSEKLIARAKERALPTEERLAALLREQVSVEQAFVPQAIGRRTMSLKAFDGHTRTQITDANV